MLSHAHGGGVHHQIGGFNHPSEAWVLIGDRMQRRVNLLKIGHKLV